MLGKIRALIGSAAAVSSATISATETVTYAHDKAETRTNAVTAGAL